MGMPVTGQLSASGRVDGPLSALKPDVRLDLQSPGVGPLRFSELWLGQLSGELGSGLELDLFSTDGSLQLQGAGSAGAAASPWCRSSVPQPGC